MVMDDSFISDKIEPKVGTFRVMTVDFEYFKIEKYTYGFTGKYKSNSWFDRWFPAIPIYDYDWYSVNENGALAEDSEKIGYYNSAEDACTSKMKFEKLTSNNWTPVSCKDCMLNKNCK
jgi:hypothetical protein